MKLVILKYNAGNVRSVCFALERIGVSAIISDDPQEILSADKIIFPGVGEASTAMNYLCARKLDQLILSLQQPVLGICLGMQLMCSSSEEGNTKCLGIFDTVVKKFEKSEDNPSRLKVPQMGWNTISELKSPLFKDLKQNEYMYFVHGYYVEKSEDTISLSNYGTDYSSALQKNNFYAVQFHPEKSAEAGQQLLKNFIEI